MSERMVTNYCKECARWARVNEENIKRATAVQEQDAAEIARLREAIKRWAELDSPDGMRRCMEWDKYDKACMALHEIAREEK